MATDDKLNSLETMAVKLMVRRGEMTVGSEGLPRLTRKGRRAMEQRRKKQERAKLAGTLTGAPRRV